jgi:hypothetical protein
MLIIAVDTPYSCAKDLPDASVFLMVPIYCRFGRPSDLQGIDRMKKRKKSPAAKKVIETEFDESVARFLQTDHPKELEDARARLRRKQEEVERDAKQIEEEFEKGPARPRKLKAALEGMAAQRSTNWGP